jgi:hypothetical protein
VNPAIKKRVDFYRSEFLMGPEAEYTLGPWWNLTHEEASQMAADIAVTMFGHNSDLYEPDVLKLACDCFQLRDGFRLDPANPLQERLLLLILAHVVFGKGRKRGRRKKSENWTSSKRHRLCALYIDIKGKQPRVSKNKIAELIASRWRMPKEVIRKQLSAGRGWIEHLEKCERESGLALSNTMGRCWRRARGNWPKCCPIKHPHLKSCPVKYLHLTGQHFRFYFDYCLLQRRAGGNESRHEENSWFQ